MSIGYQTLLALAKSTKHQGELPNASAHGFATNASCGDECDVWVRIEDDTILDVSFVAKGCVISRAAAAILAERVRDRIEVIGTMNGDDMRGLLGADISLLRERCLTTALKALQNAVSSL
ncbi:MAG: iron-sulfur cluster assembly scaffold protein [Patescibacteria group bacterium]